MGTLPWTAKERYQFHKKYKNAYIGKTGSQIYSYEWITAGYLIQLEEYRDVMQGILIIALT